MTDTPSPRTRSLVSDLLERYCAAHDLRLRLADPHGHGGLVEDPRTGKRWFFKGTRFALNSQGAAEIANDKAYTAAFLQETGLLVPRWLFASGMELRNHPQSLQKILDFAAQTGWPLFVKPNCGREGRDVIRVESEPDMQSALHRLADRYDQIIVQEAIRGKELRVVVLDGDILCAIERRLPIVIGNGSSTLGMLIKAHGVIDPEDGRLDVELSRQGLTRESVPEAGGTVTLLPVANLSCGGSAAFVTAPLAPQIRATALHSAESLALRYAAVDLILPDTNADVACVLEVNAAPGFGNLARLGADEAGRVEAIYEKVFAALFAT
ncbi:ATP-dependent carboxylate-amine ligase [Rhodobacterales bacterium]|nr:ATP-dependent carboxylate-amine ligase [Rhodobacterales bacterium]